jgi:AcrR family transcriptional regulator
MRDDGASLDPKQERAIASLLSEPTVERAAEKAGVNPATVYRWFKDDPFSIAYREARRHAVQQAIAHLQQTSHAAVSALQDVMSDSDSPASARVTAAKTILELAIRAVELEDLAARVEALERAQEGRWRN